MAGDNVEVNKQHFDKEAAAYEDKPFILEWASNVNAVMQRELSSLPADAACLDFGCGECHVWAHRLWCERAESTGPSAKRGIDIMESLTGSSIERHECLCAVQ